MKVITDERKALDDYYVAFLVQEDDDFNFDADDLNQDLNQAIGSGRVKAFGSFKTLEALYDAAEKAGYSTVDLPPVEEATN
jgi:hypothetical protein